jgi:hypothetical protein
VRRTSALENLKGALVLFGLQTEVPVESGVIEVRGGPPPAILPAKAGA